MFWDESNTLVIAANFEHDMTKLMWSCPSSRDTGRGTSGLLLVGRKSNRAQTCHCGPPQSGCWTGLRSQCHHVRTRERPGNSFHRKHTASHLWSVASCSLVTRRKVRLCLPADQTWVEKIVEHVKMLKKCCSNKPKCKLPRKVAFALIITAR